MSHLEERMETDLNFIRDWLWKLGDEVEHALRTSKKVLMLRDPVMAYDIILGDHPINRDSRECDRLCHTFIARYLPGAGALREMASTIRVNVVLERIGDYAVTICREALQLSGPLPERFATHIDGLADDAIDILSASRTAFREGNAERAIALMQAAKRMEGRMDPLYEELFAADDRMDGPTMMAIFTVFNMFRRVADQSKNICDQTVYAVRGVAKIPKVYPILFLDQRGSGIGQMAAAIGRHSFPDAAQFAVATPGGSDPLSQSLQAFLAEAGLPDNNLETEPLAALEHDFSSFIVLVSVNGSVSDYVEKLPFHTSARNWTIPQDADRAEQYRLLRREITDLVTLLAGESAGRS
jgi:phosphate transport system protein